MKYSLSELGRIINRESKSDLKYYVTYMDRHQGPFQIAEFLTMGFFGEIINMGQFTSLVISDETSFDTFQLLDEDAEFIFRNNYNLEIIGNIYYNRALNSLLLGDYENIYQNLINGFNNATSDSFLSDIIWLYKTKIKANIDACKDYSLFYLLNALYYYYTETKNRKYVIIPWWFDYNIESDPENYIYALYNINSYINLNPHYAFGLYIKSLILFGLEDFERALNALDTSLKIEKTSQSFYVLSNLKRKLFGESGVPELFHSILINPSSKDAQKLFYSLTRDGYNLKTNLDNYLVEKFNQRISGYLLSLSYLFELGYTTRNNEYYGEYSSIERVWMGFSDALISEKEIFGVVKLYADDYLNVQLKDRELPVRNPPTVRFNITGISDRYSDQNNNYDSNLDLDQQSPEFWNDIS